MQPNDSEHHDTIKLVSLNLRFRRRIASVLSTRHKVTHEPSKRRAVHAESS